MPRSPQRDKEYELGDTVYCSEPIKLESGSEYNLRGYIVGIGMVEKPSKSRGLMYLVSTKKDSKTGWPQHFDDIKPCPEDEVGLTIRKKYGPNNSYSLPPNYAVPFKSQ